METELGSLAFVLLPLLGLFVGVYGSFAGVGGGIILTPVLTLAFGLSYPQAIACTMAQMIGMSASGMFRHWRLGHIDWKLALTFLAGSIPGAVLGRLLLQELDALHGGGEGLKTAFNWIFFFLVCASVAGGLFKLLRRRPLGPEGTPRPPRRARLRTPAGRAVILVSSGLATGGLAGLLSLGGGIISLPILVGLLGVSVTTAVSTSLLQMSFSAVVATATSLGTGVLDWTVIGLLMLGSIPGATIGPVLLRGLSDRIKRRAEGEMAGAAVESIGETGVAAVGDPGRGDLAD